MANRHFRICLREHKTNSLKSRGIWKVLRNKQCLCPENKFRKCLLIFPFKKRHFNLTCMWLIKCIVFACQRKFCNFRLVFISSLVKREWKSWLPLSSLPYLVSLLGRLGPSLNQNKVWIVLVSKIFIASMLNRRLTTAWTTLLCQSIICHLDLILIFAKTTKYITTAINSILKLVKLPSLVAKYCKIQKIYACKSCTRKSLTTLASWG